MCVSLAGADTITYAVMLAARQLSGSGFFRIGTSQTMTGSARH
jgi:hypothetical protein